MHSYFCFHSEVLRDDRIWLRNKIKEVDPDVVQIFKKYLSKRPPDLSSLQVNLRKHVMKIKDRCKKEQLQKFKENLNNATCNALFEVTIWWIRDKMRHMKEAQSLSKQERVLVQK